MSYRVLAKVAPRGRARTVMVCPFCEGTVLMDGPDPSHRYQVDECQGCGVRFSIPWDGRECFRPYARQERADA
jgi:hypothetical protein